MKLSRRKFVTLSLTGLPVMGALAQLGNSSPPGRKPTVAVLEHLATKTNRTLGAAMMLKRAGFNVINLLEGKEAKDISVGSMVMNYGSKELENKIQHRIETPLYQFPVEPDIEKIDMIFFGTFANHGQPYQDFLRRYADQIPAFVEAGGIVVEMCQWGRYAFLHPGYLPEGMEIVRETWSGTDELMVCDKDHTLIKNWIGGDEALLKFPKQWHRPGRFFEGNRSWESIAEWRGMRLLLGAGGGYRQTLDIPGRAALVEGQHGKGRYLLSSLWLDKLFDKNGKAQAAPGTMRIGQRFFDSLYKYAETIKDGKAAKTLPTDMAPEPLIGPVLGHIDHERAILWMRGNEAAPYKLIVWKQGERPGQGNKSIEMATPENDYCIKWQCNDLSPDTRYCYSIENDKGKLFDGKVFSFQTSSAPGVPAKTVIAFGSCVDQNGRFAELWKQVEACGAQGMVLLGDTPYIDSTVLVQQRIKHRTFLSQEGPAYLSKNIPFWATWDDHDFGANGSDGQIHNRQHTRQVFKEYRALTQFGENEEGVYSSFRNGPVEVFILDIRYFAGMGASFAAPDKPTLIGNRQWEWLKEKLKASTAPFKILASGMTWDAGVTQHDDWENFAYEREAIIDFIGAEKITGVLLVGGDIHCTQVMKYDTASRIGYPLYHIVTSPMHNRVIRGNEKLQHPGMLFARAAPNTFLKITANTLVKPSLLTAEIIDISGQCIYRLVTGAELGL